MITPFEWIQHPLMHAISLALLHFIWQGMLVAGGLALALKLNKKASPRFRYGVCTASLVLLVALPLSTAVQLHMVQPESAARSGVVKDIPIASDTRIERDFNLQEESADALQAVAVEAVDQPTSVPWNGLVVVAWLMGITFFSMRLIAGLKHLDRLKRSSMPVENAELKNMMQALIRRMQLAQPVRLHVSEVVTRPMLIGWLKPMILLPTSVVTGVAPEHIKAILVHELIHIRRHDYLVLLVQSVIEVLFFYHPAVWWVSAQMRIEREYCCDAESAVVLHNKSVYARALLDLEQRRVALPQPAGQRFALFASGGRLVDRIRRMTEPEGVRSSSVVSWLSVAIVLLLGSSVIIACTQMEKPETPAMKYAKAWDIIMEIRDSRTMSLGNLATAKLKLPQVRSAIEEAADAGSVCGIKWMPYVIDFELTAGMNGSKRKDSIDLGPHRDEILVWSRKFEDALRERIEQGNADAMLWLSRGYDPYWELPELAHLPKSDSLADMWLNRAIALENPQAIATLANKTEDKDERKRLIEKAARLGNAFAYRQWAFYNIYDPVTYFEIASMAIDANIDGARSWISEGLDQLDEQIGLGNQESIPYKRVADSLRIRERVAALPDTELPFYVESLCENGVDRWGP